MTILKKVLKLKNNLCLDFKEKNKIETVNKHQCHLITFFGTICKIESFKKF